jgi:hypothetical protein
MPWLIFQSTRGFDSPTRYECATCGTFHTWHEILKGYREMAFSFLFMTAAATVHDSFQTVSGRIFAVLQFPGERRTVGVYLEAGDGV